MHAGYGQEHVDLERPTVSNYHSAWIDIGIDYSREFSLARRTTLAFNTTTSVVRYEGVEGEFRRHGDQSRSSSHLVGYGAVQPLTVAPRWITELLVTDTVSASLGGMLSRRLDFVSEVNAARGESNFLDVTGFATFTLGHAQRCLGRPACRRIRFIYGLFLLGAGRRFNVDPARTTARQTVSVGLKFSISPSMKR